MRSDNMPRPFAPEHGEEAAPDLQRDIKLVAGEICHESEAWPAWQRLKPRLTPDREKVAEAIKDVLNDHGWETDRHDRPALLQAADAAIAAMGETP